MSDGFDIQFEVGETYRTRTYFGLSGDIYIEVSTKHFSSVVSTTAEWAWPGRTRNPRRIQKSVRRAGERLLRKERDLQKVKELIK